jgi:hypothetical protein
MNPFLVIIALLLIVCIDHEVRINRLENDNDIIEGVQDKNSNKTSPWIYWLLGVIALILLFIAFMYWRQWHGPPRPTAPSYAPGLEDPLAQW